MFYKQKEYEKVLEEYVESYIAYRECMTGDKVITDEEVTEATNRWFASSAVFGAFKEDEYGESNRNFPNMETYFQTSDGTYHDFAYRTYSAVYKAKQLPPEQEWRIFTLVRIGELLRNFYLHLG